ncbi:MAG: hypothetical protein OXG83_06570 [Acidobacteria bacterium]|nr:hypothetical protein [Acidobacteriota bacterium]
MGTTLDRAGPVIRLLQRRRLPVAVGVLAALLLLPALWGGFQLDDHLQRFRLLGLGDPSIQLFVFYDGDPLRNRAQIEEGTLPWWASPDLRHANFRYLSVLSMQLDYLLWPDLPALMHLHSLVWLGLCVGVAAALYRRLFGREGRGAPWAAGLAALLYAVDDAHSLPAAYIANRNALLATFFGLLCLECHARWRDDGWRVGGVLAPSCLALSLLSAELGVSTVALLGAWVLVLDRGSWRRRLLSVLPHAGVALAWFLAYRIGGFGAQGSGVYVDPLGDPAGFVSLLADRTSALILGQWTPFPADWAFVMDSGTSAAWGLRFAALTLVVGLGWLFFKVLRRSPLARFFLLGAVLSLVPISAVGPQNRLLFFVGFCSMGLLACVAAGPLDASRRLAFGGFLVFHLLVAPVAAYVFLDVQNRAARRMETASESVPDDAGLERRDLILVNPTDSVYLTTSVVTMRWADGRAAPRRVRVLSNGLTDVRVVRVGETELLVEPAAGLFPDPFSRYHRSSERPFLAGDVTELSDLRVEVLEVDPGGGGPTSIRYDFAEPLEAERYLWMAWNGSRYEDWVPPDVGQEIVLRPVPGIFE